MKKITRLYVLFFCVLFLGFSAGILLPKLVCMRTGSYAGLISRYSLNRYQERQGEILQIFPYVFMVRFRTLLFLWMSSFTALGLIFHGIYFWWTAVSGGMMLALFLLQSGNQGTALFICCLLPQWIIYVAMWKAELGGFLKRKYRDFQWEQEKTGSLESRRELLLFARLSADCLAGSAIETFMSIWTLKILLRLFF